MRSITVRVIGALLVLGLLLPGMAPSVAAAPAITATPAQTPPGGNVTVTGTGFSPNATLALFGITAVGNRPFRLANFTAGADGGFTATFRVAGFFPPGSLPLTVVSVPGDTVLAQATVTVTNAPSVATEKLTINPNGGPVGTRLSATGEGFAAGTTVAFFTTDLAKGLAVPEATREVARLRIPADGRVAFDFDTASYIAGQHDLYAYTDGNRIGYPLVRLVFDITAPSAPGMPNTGGGAAAHPAAGWGPLLLTLVPAVLGLAGGALRRRRARRQGA